jgi:hypothetical protein
MVFQALFFSENAKTAALFRNVYPGAHESIQAHNTGKQLPCLAPRALAHVGHAYRQTRTKPFIINNLQIKLFFFE